MKADGYAAVANGFRQGLKETGYVEGQNVAIKFRWADGEYASFHEFRFAASVWCKPEFKSEPKPT